MFADILREVQRCNQGDWFSPSPVSFDLMLVALNGMKEDLESRQPVTSAMCQPSCKLRDMQDYGLRSRSYERYLNNTAAASTYALMPT